MKAFEKFEEFWQLVWKFLYDTIFADLKPKKD